MAREYAAHGVSFIFVYTREAHPGELYPHHSSFAQKLEHARAMVRRDSMARPMLVDDLQGTLHHAYGRLPNMSYIVGGGGKILYRASWTEAENLRLVLDRIVGWRQAQREGTTLRPFHVEWQPSVAADRRGFVKVLLETAGPRAVTEYVEALDYTMGEGVARPLREWWEKTRAL